jgi:hypothetical protein
LTTSSGVNAIWSPRAETRVSGSGAAVSPYRMPTLHNDGSGHQHWGSEE